MRTLVFAFACLWLVTLLQADPMEQVSREDWSYDALASLAVRGLVPGKSARDFSLLYQYSRGEMAQMVADALRAAPDPDALPPRESSLLRKLVVEYDKELRQAGVEPPALPQTPLLATALGELDVQFQSDSEAEEHGWVGARLSALYDLTPPDTFLDVQANAGHDVADPLFGDKVRTPFSRAVLRTHHSWYEFAVGRQQIRWGPGYLSSTSLSDLSRPYWLADFSTDIHIGKYRLPYRQFLGAFQDAGMRKWIVGRRLEVPLGSRLTWTLGEFAKSRNVPHPATVVLPLQAAQEWFIKKEVGTPGYENELNIVVTTDVTCRFGRRLEGYVEWTLDDAQIELFGFGGANVPYKSAYLVGLYSPDILGNGKTSGRVEYAFSTEQMGLHRDARMALFNEGVPMGHAIGPDSDALFLRVDQRLGDRDSAAVRFQRTQHGRHLAAVQTDTALDLTYTRDICANGFVTATVQRFATDNVGNVAGADLDASRLFVTASARY
jgi:hypothetical protein